MKQPLKRFAGIFGSAIIAAATILPTASAFAAGPNLIANPGFETAADTLPASWSQGRWGTNTSAFTYDTSGHAGSRAASINVSGYSSGDAKWYSAPVAVTPSATYTFSNWYKSNVATNLDAVVTTTAGTTQYYYISNPVASTVWKQQTATFVAPANAKQVTFYHSISKVGSLSVDDYSLTDNAGTDTPTPTPIPTPTPTPTPTPSPTPAPTPTPPPASSNLLTNPSVETATNSLPSGWAYDSWGTNTPAFTYENTGQDGTHSVKTSVTQYTNGDAKWYFLPVTVTPGKTYAYTEYYKSNVVSEVDAMVTLKDGTVQYIYLGVPAASASAWSKLSYQYVAPANAATVTIFHVIAKVGYVQSDNFSFSAYTPARFNRALVSLTFDDGWRTIATKGMPLLNKYGLVSTQYLNSKPIVGGYPDYMTYQMVKDYKAQGSELAWHTQTHADLATLTAAKVDMQLTIPAAFLTGINDTKATFQNFATPFGSYNPQAITEIKKFYGSHRSTDVGYNNKDTFDRYNIKVQNITNTTTPAIVQGWLNQAATDNTWLVIVYHEVDASAADSTYSVTPANLDAELNLVKQSGLTVKTVAGALNEITPQL